MGQATKIGTTSSRGIQFGAHATAVFRDGAHIAVYSDGTNFVYNLTRDNGATWSPKQTIASPGLNSGEQHYDTCQNGDVVYGAYMNWTGTVWQMVPFKLAYQGGVVTATLGSGTTVANFSSPTGDPSAGGNYLSVSWDPDHQLFHVAAIASTGLAAYAITTALATAYSDTATNSLTATNDNVPTVYVPAFSSGSSGTIWAMNDNGTNNQFAHRTVSATAYGAWSAFTTSTGENLGHGAGGYLDTTQAPAQPLFCFQSGNGNLWVATYNGTSWTSTQLSPGNTGYGIAVICVGHDIWIVYGSSSQNDLVKRINGTWQSSGTLVDSAGDRPSFPAVNQATGALILIYVDTGPSNVWSQTYFLGNDPRYPTVTLDGYTYPMVTAPAGGAPLVWVTPTDSQTNTDSASWAGAWTPPGDATAPTDTGTYAAPWAPAHDSQANSDTHLASAQYSSTDSTTSTDATTWNEPWAPTADGQAPADSQSFDARWTPAADTQTNSDSFGALTSYIFVDSQANADSASWAAPWAPAADVLANGDTGNTTIAAVWTLPHDSQADSDTHLASPAYSATDSTTSTDATTWSLPWGAPADSQQPTDSHLILLVWILAPVDAETNADTWTATLVNFGSLPTITVPFVARDGHAVFVARDGHSTFVGRDGHSTFVGRDGASTFVGRDGRATFAAR